MCNGQTQVTFDAKQLQQTDVKQGMDDVRLLSQQSQTTPLTPPRPTSGMADNADACIMRPQPTSVTPNAFHGNVGRNVNMRMHALIWCAHARSLWKKRKGSIVRMVDFFLQKTQLKTQMNWFPVHDAL